MLLRLNDFVNACKPLSRKLVAMHIGAVKDKILGRIVNTALIKKETILTKLSCLDLIASNHDPDWILLPECFQQMCFLRVNAAADHYRMPQLAKRLFNFFYPCHPLHRLKKCFHTSSILQFLFHPLNLFIAQVIPSVMIQATASQAL